MEAVIAAAALGLFVPCLKCLPERPVPVLSCEVQHAGGAAQRRSPGARPEVIRRNAEPDIKVKVGMGVYEAGHDVAARSVYHFRARSVKIAAYGDYPVAVGEYILTLPAICVYYGSVLDEYAHCLFPPKWYRLLIHKKQKAPGCTVCCTLGAHSRPLRWPVETPVR